jgi:hypothetical protein
MDRFLATAALLYAQVPLANALITLGFQAASLPVAERVSVGSDMLIAVPSGAAAFAAWLPAMDRSKPLPPRKAMLPGARTEPVGRSSACRT